MKLHIRGAHKRQRKRKRQQSKLNTEQEEQAANKTKEKKEERKKEENEHFIGDRRHLEEILESQGNGEEGISAQEDKERG